MIGKPRKLIVSWRCTSEMTRLLRDCWKRWSRRRRLASSIFCRMIGCTAEIMKNSQSTSPKPIVISLLLVGLRSPGGVLGTPRPLLGSARAKQRRHRHAHHEPADVCPPRHAAGSLHRGREPDGAVQDLHREPEAEVHRGRNLDHTEEQEDERHQRVDAGVREEDEVGAESGARWACTSAA